MSKISTKTLPKRIATKHKGVYFKNVQQTSIDGQGKLKTKIIDKVFIIRYRKENKEVLVTLGKYSEGIREAYCKTKRAEYLTLAKNGELPPQVEKRVKKKITTLDHLADMYFLDMADINKANIKQRQRYNLHIKEHLGSRGILSINRDDILKLRKAITQKGRSNNTTNGIITLLKAIINHNIKEKGLVIVNPCIGIKNLKIDDRRERYLTLDEVNKLILEVKGLKTIYHLVKLSLMTGARLESVLHIQKKDVSLNTNSVTIHDLKSGGTYTGFYDDSYKTELSSHIKPLKVNDYIVGGKEVKTASRTIQRHLKPILDTLFNGGLDVRDTKNRVVIHTLRHTFASQLAIAGVPILTIKNLMHHADITQTMRYAKLAPDQGIEAVKGLYKC